MSIEHVPQQIGFIGAGNMASAIIGGLLDAGLAPDRICAADPSEAAREALATRGITAIAPAPSERFREVELVVLAVKPQLMAGAVEDLKPHVAADCALMSVAAGISIASLQSMIGHAQQPTVRCMPNTPALVRAGASALYASPEVDDAQRLGIQSVMSVVGTVQWLTDEAQIDMVTAVSGSGPAYFFAFMEAMIAAGERMGLPHDITSQLTLQTALGAAKLAAESSDPIDELRRKVTSPGGTTARALASFERSGLSDVVDRGMEACLQRAREMAEEFK